MRFFATDAASTVEKVSKAAASEHSSKTTGSSEGSKQPSGNGPKRGGRRGNRNGKNTAPVSKNSNNAAAAAAVATQDNGTKEADNISRVTTRLVDNHPITEEDRDPRYYLSHLTEDKLDPDVPVFKEDRMEFPDNYSQTLHITDTDEYGHKVTEIKRVPSKKEQDLNALGFSFPDERTFGVNYYTPPIIGNGPILEGDVAKGEVGKQSRDDEYEEGNYETVFRDGQYLDGTVLVPGSDKQMQMDMEQMSRGTFALKARRQRRQIERGYDHREVGNSAPWVDTHRIEAIDARLRDLHAQREEGLLEYPLEKDAAEEAQRIRAEEKQAVDAIRSAIGLHDEKPLGDRYLYQQDDPVPSVSVRGRRVNSKVIHKPIVAKTPASTEDASLDTMEVYSIPVEKLYQARRQELERLRTTHYEDYDLSYLLQQSGKSMTRREGAPSLYEHRHGHDEQDRLPTEEEKEHPILGASRLRKPLTATEKAELGQQLAAYERYNQMDTDTAMAFYSPYLQAITPAMEEAERAFLAEQAAATAAAVAEENATEGTIGAQSQLFEKRDETLATPASTSGIVESTVAGAAADTAVSPALDAMIRDSTKPLSDLEIGRTEKDEVMIAWRRHRSALPDYLGDRAKFQKGMESLLQAPVSEETQKKAMETVMTEEDLEAMRRAVGQPEDVDKKTFYRRYLRHKGTTGKEGEVIGKLMTGYSLREDSDRILKELGIDTEDGIENYLMDTFKPHPAPDEMLMSPEQRDAMKLLQESAAAVQDANALIDAAEKKKKEEAEKQTQEQAEGGEAAPEAKAEGEESPAAETPAETTEEARGEDGGEDGKKSKKSKKTTTAQQSADEAVSYADMSPQEAIQRMRDRLEKDQEAANQRVPTTASYASSTGHLVDALEYSRQVYVHERDREVIYHMYQEQHYHPQEIARLMGFHEKRVYAIIKLMKNREVHKENGTFNDTLVKKYEEQESPFRYDYRDMPPANFKKADRRRKGKQPSMLPRFVFLQEGEEEAVVMKDIHRLMNKKRRASTVNLNRPEAAEQEAINNRT